jgi:hypothetical protein
MKIITQSFEQRGAQLHHGFIYSELTGFHPVYQRADVIAAGQQ